VAYSVNWIDKEVFIPSSDLVLVSGDEYDLIMDSFHREIRRLEWEFSEGLWADQILVRTPSVTISGQTSFPTDTIINDYKIIFDPTIEKVTLRGSNNNIIDVFVPNGVSVIPTNSFGNSIVEVPVGLTEAEVQQIFVTALQSTMCE